MDNQAWNEPYQISVTMPDGWWRFDLERQPINGPNGEKAMQTKVYFNGQHCLTHVGDMPTDIHDTDEIIDVLNTEFQLELY